MNTLNSEAKTLNTIIEKFPAISAFLSPRGKAIYFPQQGIFAQSKEAKNTKINATIGMAYNNNGEIMHLNAISKPIHLPAKDFLSYAPCGGVEPLRQKWLALIYQKYPRLINTNISLPIVTVGITQALSIIAGLFLSDGDEIIIPSPFWENYRLIMEKQMSASITSFELFEGQSLNLNKLKELLNEKGDKKTLLLNFPHNPSGYMPTKNEMQRLFEIIKKAANKKQILIICDDAYEGQIYQNDCHQASPFEQLADLHENIFAIKIDGITKEYSAWGLRVGFITFGIKHGTKELYDALSNKTTGMIRASISNNSHLSQTITLQALSNPECFIEKAESLQLLKKRHGKIKSILEQHKQRYQHHFIPLPFNSGYFLCLALVNSDPEMVRKLLIEKYSTGVITFNPLIRISYASVPDNLLEELFENIYNACCNLQPV